MTLRVTAKHRRAICGGVFVCALLFATSPAPVHAYSDTLSPGARISVKHRNGSASICTLGPMVVDRNAQRAFITAGHCGHDGDSVYWVKDTKERVFLGSIYGSVDTEIKGEVHDYALIPFDAPASADVLGRKTYDDMTVGELDARPGSILCTYGAVSGERCGKTISSDMSEGEVVVRMNSSHGDSGSPVYMYRKAEGFRVILVGILRGVRNADRSLTVVIPLSTILGEYRVTAATTA